MKSIRLVAVVAGVLVAVLAFLLISTGSRNSTGTKTSETAVVVVALNDIPENTVIKAEMVQLQTVALDAKHDMAYEKIDDVVGKFTLSKIVKGEQILSSRIVTKSDDKTADTYGLAYTVTSGMRAVSVNVSYQQGIAGLLKIGNYVDVIASVDAATALGSQISSEVNVQNFAIMAFQKLKILAIDSVITDEKTSTSYGTLTFEVTPEQALQLAYISSGSSITLALRSQYDDADANVEPISIYDVVDIEELVKSIADNYQEIKKYSSDLPKNPTPAQA